MKKSRLMSVSVSNAESQASVVSCRKRRVAQACA